MGFFNAIFSKNSRQSSKFAGNDNNTNSSLPSHTSIMEGDTSSIEAEPSKKYITLSAATGYPIDAIYEFILRDLEVDGYNDALVNSDISYCQQAENILRNKLDLLFDRVTLIYKEKMRKIELHSRLANDALVYSAVASLSASNETMKEHMSKIAEMQQKAKAGDETFLNMIASYRRGFMKGLTDACEQLISNNYNSLKNMVKDEDTK